MFGERVPPGAPTGSLACVSRTHGYSKSCAPPRGGPAVVPLGLAELVRVPWSAGVSGLAVGPRGVLDCFMERDQSICGEVQGRAACRGLRMTNLVT